MGDQLTDEALYKKVARKVLTETLRMRKGETLTIETWNTGLDFARRLVVEARRLGVVPIVVAEDEDAYVEGVKVTPKDVLGKMGKQEYGLLAGSDAYVFIPGPPIAAYYPKLSRQEFLDSTKYNESWYEAASKARLRGARLPFGYVGKDYARLYGKRPEEFVRSQLKAALADYTAMSATGRAIGLAMRDWAGATVVSGRATLRFTLKGDLEVEDGIVSEDDLSDGNNMTYIPPGYVAKQVDPPSANGAVAISPSATRLGLVKDAELEFEGGKLARWKSKVSKKILDDLVEGIAPEKRVLSTVQVGINPSLRYESGQDRMVAGAIGLGGFGFVAIVRKGSLSVGGKAIVQQGKLASPG